MEDKIKRFENLLLSVNRQGIDKLIEFIRKSDMYTAPASTKFHSCHEGGLLEHSLNVYDCLLAKKDSIIWKEYFKTIPDETIIITALLHDLCKTYFYEVDYKNQKIYSENGSKKDEKGKFDWQTVPFYKVNDKIPLGHGEKSVMMIEEFIRLKPVERYAIRWHMLFSEENSLTAGNAVKLHKLVLAINEADMEATYLLEKEE